MKCFSTKKCRRAKTTSCLQFGMSLHFLVEKHFFHLKKLHKLFLPLFRTFAIPKLPVGIRRSSQQVEKHKLVLFKSWERGLICQVITFKTLNLHEVCRPFILCGRNQMVGSVLIELGVANPSSFIIIIAMITYIITTSQL